jgi:hypothetical protein
MSVEGLVVSWVLLYRVYDLDLRFLQPKRVKKLMHQGLVTFNISIMAAPDKRMEQV